ncbi:MAG: TorF family putative porin, partial [Caulobacteraceae bacterium]
LRALGVALAVVSPCLARPAEAQWAIAVAADSDERFRGLSLSDGRPVASASIAYDHDSGAYAGATAIGVEGSGNDPRPLGYIGYAGWSARFKAGLAWDVGVTHARYTAPASGGYTADYTEVYVGLVGDNLSAHLYYSPNYFGEGAQTVYADLAGAVRPGRRWRLFGQVGALTVVGGRSGPGGQRASVDVRAGVAFDFKACELRLAWTAIGGGPSYPSQYPQARDGFALGATYAF